VHAVHGCEFGFAAFSAAKGIAVAGSASKRRPALIDKLRWLGQCASPDQRMRGEELFPKLIIVSKIYEAHAVSG